MPAEGTGRTLAVDERVGGRTAGVAASVGPERALCGAGPHQFAQLHRSDGAGYGSHGGDAAAGCQITRQFICAIGAERIQKRTGECGRTSAGIESAVASAREDAIQQIGFGRKTGIQQGCRTDSGRDRLGVCSRGGGWRMVVVDEDAQARHSTGGRCSCCASACCCACTHPPGGTAPRGDATRGGTSSSGASQSGEAQANPHC